MPFRTKLSLLSLTLVASISTRAGITYPPSALESHSARFAETNFIDQQGKLTASQRQEANQELVRALGETHESVKDPQRFRGSISEANAKRLYQILESHSVASSAASSARDTKGGIGFCFGRAYFVHIRALGADFNMAPDQIRKIWVTGTLKSGGITWGHHVATMVKAEGKGWWVIDPVTGLVKADQWVEKLKGFNPSGDASFFVSDASRFSPYSNLPYRKIDLDDPANFYLNFFNDLRDVERERIELEEGIGEIAAQKEKPRRVDSRALFLDADRTERRMLRERGVLRRLWRGCADRIREIFD